MINHGLSPGQMESQVDSSWKLGSTCDPVWPMKCRICLPWNVFFLRLACTCEETCESVWPPNASLYANSTCAHLRLLAGPFDQGFMSVTQVEMTDISSQFAIAWYLAPNGVQIVAISFGCVFDVCVSNKYTKDHIFDLRGKNIWKYDWSSQLSPGQTDRQVVASGRSLNLRRDLRWVAKRLASFSASTRKSQKRETF